MQVQFLKPPSASMKEFQETVKAKGKPGIVFVTQEWCGACDFLKSNINESALKDRMNEFTVMSVEGDAGHAFQKDDNKDDYVPRVYFLNKDGTFYERGVAPNPEFEFFFPGADSVLKILDMLKADNEKMEAVPATSQGEM